MAKIIRQHISSSFFSFFSFFFLVSLLGLIFPVVRGKVPAVIVFGDSSVDTGNNNGIETLLKSNFEPYGRNFEGGRPTGRFSNGRVPVDFFSEYYGLKKTVPAYLDPNYGMEDFVTGVNFASAGTGYDNTTSAVLNVIPVWQEIEYYKEYIEKLHAYVGEVKANEIITEAVYLVSMGTNDFLENYYLLPTTQACYTIQEFEDHLVGLARKFVEEIYSLGARKISLAGVPPMGCLPLERTINLMAIHECNEEYNNVALEFNAKVKGLVNQLNMQLPGIKVFLSNPYNVLRQMIRKPSIYGMEVTYKACCGTGLLEMSYLCSLDNSLTCSDADKYVFWDSFHPTEKTNRIMAEHLFKTVLYKFL
ncbi:GDSL esterase/lipase At2g42990 [Beta vulgaris subsp. vulgaris]|uniref:GDSL esterase/lipase At2g42990 n=1 Tax=Beta vulgaris subsp. vulgaris TaxID=3555 RepID=UPI002036DBFB|nr:GDSL esterase/lipase At2g42990 [Beta vulgaris subsp. vulgaris]